MTNLMTFAFRPMTKGIALLSLLTIVGFGSVGGAYAQSSTEQLMNQIRQLRGEIADLQKVVYKGDVPPSSSAAVGDRQIAGQLQVQIQQLEAQRRTMMGQLEELDNKIRRMENRLDKLVSDVDYRLQALEGGRVGAAPNPGQQQFGEAPQQQFAAPQAQTQQLPNGTTIISSGGTVPAPQGQQQPGVLGQVTEEDLAALRSGELQRQAQQAQQQAAATAPQVQNQPMPSASAVPAPGSVTTETSAANTPSVILQGNTPEDQYKYAQSLLHQHDFNGAESALRAFIDQNGEHQLASNAMYWLGETYYARKQFSDAAAVFSDAYLRDRKASKATHSLLKLAMSLEQLGEAENACVTYQELLSKHEDAEPRILSRAKSARQTLGCQ